MPGSNHELTVEQVEQLGRLLIPVFRDAMRHDLGELRAGITEDLKALREDTIADLERHRQATSAEIVVLKSENGRLATRIHSLEMWKYKTTGAVAAIAAIFEAIRFFLHH
jgi:hypothetical protein